MGREASRASHRPRAPGRAPSGRLVGGALSAAVPVPGGLLVGLLARREPDSGWGAPSFHADRRRYRPALQDLLGITQARGRRTRMGELSHKDMYPLWLH